MEGNCQIKFEPLQIKAMPLSLHLALQELFQIRDQLLDGQTITAKEPTKFLLAAFFSVSYAEFIEAQRH